MGLARQRHTPRLEDNRGWGPASWRTAFPGGEGRDLWCSGPWSPESHGTWDFEPERSGKLKWAAGAGGEDLGGLWAGLRARGRSVWAGTGCGPGSGPGGVPGAGRGRGRRDRVCPGGGWSRGWGRSRGRGGGGPLPCRARHALGSPRRGGCLAGRIPAHRTPRCPPARARNRGPAHLRRSRARRDRARHLWLRPPSSPGHAARGGGGSERPPGPPVSAGP